MLNYIWMALIFLGLAAAVTTDISDSATNRFKNNVALKIERPEGLDYSKEKQDLSIRIKSQDFNHFFGADTDKDLILAGKATRKGNSDTLIVNMKLPADAPEILKIIAASNGKADDFQARLFPAIPADTADSHASVLFEEVTFRKVKEITGAIISYSETAVNIALGLIGIMALWLGVMKIADQAGVINFIAKVLRPVIRRLFPDVPTDHPAVGAIIMNVSANFLGLSNAATPFGLKAMEELDKLNENKGTATNAMCTFLAINTAGMTLIPATAIAIRASAGSSEPAIIIGTSLFGSFCATVTAIISVKILENFPMKLRDIPSVIKEKKKTILKVMLFVASALAVISAVFFSGILKNSSFLTAENFKNFVQFFSVIAIPLIMAIFITAGLIKKVKVYESFVEGAKEGFNIAIRIIPYLVAMLMAIGVFRAGGAMDWLIAILTPATNLIGMPAEALPMALMRPLSGSGSLGIMAEIIAIHGPDSFIGILVSTFFGSTETTFYVLAVYFGSVGIKNTRHALPAGLLADIAGILGATFIVRLLFFS